MKYSKLDYIISEGIRHLIFESADYVGYVFLMDNGKVLKVVNVSMDYTDDGAFPFFITNDLSEIYVGEESGTHIELFGEIGELDGEIIDIDNYSEFGYTGRVFIARNGFQFISFWNMPPLGQWNKVYSLFSEKTEFDIGNFWIIVGENDKGSIAESAVSLIDSDLVHGQYGMFDDKKNDELRKLHLMNARDKRNTPEMSLARKEQDSLKGKLLGSSDRYSGGNTREVPEAEYNFYRHYGIGESRKHKRRKNNIII